MTTTKISPSTFMRQLRPENYSDTQTRTAFELEPAVFDHHLDTITSRNQTHDFEIFCRKLCERTICPNLRPQTGPDGGGDSKADSETVPVAYEIATRTFVGEQNAGREKWAFAFSAKEDWVAKVRSDVAGIAGTERGYKRVFFVTSRYAKAKTRAQLEQDLSKEYGFEVTIHDRTWIVNEVIDGARKDIAYNYLGVGREVTEAALGPSDYSRSRQLEDIEKALADPAHFEGMRTQEVTEALLAAKLSRGIERPRHETDGRFARAVRLAKAHGTTRQKYETQYEALWTPVWWFDDIELVNSEYDAFEAVVIGDDSTKNLEFLSNLLQMLINAVIHGDFTAEHCDLEARSVRLYARLDEIAAETERPNNALEAETLRLHGRFNVALRADDHAAISELWPRYGDVLKRAETLGEFDAKHFVRLIEAIGEAAGNDPAYTALIEQAAAFVSARTGAAEGALMLVRRARKLDFDEHFEMIRLLGKAVRHLAKKEYAEELIEALQRLCLAYRSAGLLWAARASSIFAAASIAIQGEEDSELDVSLIPTLKLLAWISLELRHVPDFLQAIQLLNGCLSGMPLTDESKSVLKGELTNFDYAFASFLLNSTPIELQQLSALPDILEALSLYTSRTALLYAMGHEDGLRADEWIPEEESSENVAQMFAILASQPVSDGLRGPIMTNPGGRQRLEATVMGMVIEINFEGADASILVAEVVAAAVEACFATAFELDIHPHAERYIIDLVEDEIAEPSFDVDALRPTARLVWPTGRLVSAYGHGEDTIRFLTQVALMTLAATCVMHDGMKSIERLTEDEGVFDRVTMITVVGNSYRRLFSASLARLDDWAKVTRASYLLQPSRPKIERIKLSPEEPESDPEVVRASPDQKSDFMKGASHRNVAMLSVIDYHLWNQAGWQGALYARLDRNIPPILALVFKDAEAGQGIFTRWRERFGSSDDAEEIYIAIIRDVSAQHPLHYNLMVTSSRGAQIPPDQKSAMVLSRFQRMQATSDEHLRAFLSEYERLGTYVLVPAVIVDGEPRMLMRHGIIKRRLIVKSAKDIGPTDIESCALGREANEHFEGAEEPAE